MIAHPRLVESDKQSQLALYASLSKNTYQSSLVAAGGDAKSRLRRHIPPMF